MQQSFLSFWQQKQYHGLITSWLYEFGKERRLGEFPQFAKYKGQYIHYGLDPKFQSDILQFGACHSSFVATRIPTDKGFNIDNIRNSHRCDSRLCPLCETIHARKEYSQLTWRMEQLKDDYDFFFLTLTIENIEGNFWEHIQLLNYCAEQFYQFFGKKRKDGWSKGFYGNWEVTYKGKGFHPHLHIVIAVPKGSWKNLALTKKGKIKGIDYKEKTYKDGSIEWKHTSQYQLVDLYREFMIRGHAKLNLSFPLTDSILKYPHLDFIQCYNIEKDVRELCKYFLDVTQLPDREHFLIYAQSIYHVKRKKKTGVFRFTKQDEAEWQKYLDEYHASIKQNKNCIDCVFSIYQKIIDNKKRKILKMTHVKEGLYSEYEYWEYDKLNESFNFLSSSTEPIKRYDIKNE